MHSKIVSHSGGYVGQKGSGIFSQMWNAFTSKRGARSRRKSPKVVLQPSSNPGDCWTMTGQSGHVSVKLNKLLKVTNVSIQHISDQIAPKYGSTIKEFRIWGRAEALGDTEDYLMGSFSYQKTSSFRIPTIQFATFKESEWLDTVTLEVLQNWGEPTYTCIYRFRIHGEADSWGNFPSATFNLSERSTKLSAKSIASFV
uniref:SUN domain-containing protein n=1 Tax=Lotharella oceanica TaxID=641309 RepID=A0A7S2TEI3_9EUKA